MLGTRQTPVISALRSQESEAARLNLSLASSYLKTIPSLVGRWVLKTFSCSLYRSEPLSYESQERGLVGSDASRSRGKALVSTGTEASGFSTTERRNLYSN